MALQRGKCALLVRSHEAAIASHVGCEDGRKLALDTILSHSMTS